MKLTALRVVAPLALFTVALSGCAASEPDASSDIEAVSDVAQDAHDAAEADSADAGDDASSSSVAAAFESITSCDQIAAVVAPYIEGLELDEEGSGPNDYGIGCYWVPPEDIDDFSMIRAIDIQLEDAAGSAEPDLSLFLDMDGASVHEDPWLEEQGGVAYSLALGTSVAGATAITVWLPDVEVTIGGGQWGDYPALDGPAAIEVTRQLLGG